MRVNDVQINDLVDFLIEEPREALQIEVERVDYVVSILPRIGALLIRDVSLRLAIPDDVQPMPRPTFAVMR